MPNDIYNTARYRFATAQLDWTKVPLVLIAWAGPPTFVVTDVSIAGIISRGTTLAIGHSMPIMHQAVSPQGYLQTDTVVVPAVPVGNMLTHFIMASFSQSWDDGVPLLYIDDALDLPFQPNGLDVTISPDWLQQRGWGRV